MHGYRYRRSALAPGVIISSASVLGLQSPPRSPLDRSRRAPASVRACLSIAAGARKKVHRREKRRKKKTAARVAQLSQPNQPDAPLTSFSPQAPRAQTRRLAAPKRGPITAGGREGFLVPSGSSRAQVPFAEKTHTPAVPEHMRPFFMSRRKHTPIFSPSSSSSPTTTSHHNTTRSRSTHTGRFDMRRGLHQSPSWGRRRLSNAATVAITWHRYRICAHTGRPLIHIHRHLHLTRRHRPYPNLEFVGRVR